MVRLETTGVLLAQPTRYVVQKATWPSAGSLVIQLMFVAKGVMLVIVTEEIMGGVVSLVMGVGVGVGVKVEVGVGVGVGEVAEDSVLKPL